MPSPEQIQQRAYELYEARGGAPGHDWDDWLLAEELLRGELALRAQIAHTVERAAPSPAS